jgi:hypothetical protein
MPRSKALSPSFRLHKRSGQAIVTLGDRMVYLGEHGTDESRAEYDHPLLDLHGPSAVSEFTPLALKACREQMIASG